VRVSSFYTLESVIILLISLNALDCNMKKTLLIIGAIFAALMLFYGAVSTLVNQGHALGSSLMTFLLVIGGTAALIWMVKSNP